MLHPFAIETALAQLPAWIEVNFEKTRSKAARSANFQFRKVPAQGSAQQHDAIIASDHAEAILQCQILPCYANGKAVTVGIAIANPSKVEVQQQWLDGLRRIGIHLPAQALIIQLLQNQQAMRRGTPWLSQDNQLTLIDWLLAKNNHGGGYWVLYRRIGDDDST